MTRLIQGLAIFAALALPAAADYVPWPTAKDICVYACYDWTDHIVWQLPPELEESEDYYMVLCSAEIKYKSIYVCAQAHCSDAERHSGLKLLNQTCQLNAGISLPSVEQFQLSPEALAAVPQLPHSRDDTNSSVVCYPDADWLELSLHTDWTFYGNIWLSYDFVWSFYAYWALVIFCGMVYRVLNLIVVHNSQPWGFWTWFRRRLLLPATFGRHCQEPVWGATIPPRLETLVLVVFAIMNFVYCFPGYALFDNNQYFATYGIQISRYIADRTAHLSVALIPLMWIFATRNDPLLWLTGWSFATFNRFHRWIARIAWVHALVHSAAWTANYLYPDSGGFAGYAAEWPEVWWYTGVIATIIMSLMLPASIWWIREKFYDLFLTTHFLMAIIFLVTMYYHVYVLIDQYFGFLWPCVAIWALDRLMRFARIIYMSALPRFRKGVKAVATYDKRSEMIRLDITDFFHRDHVASPGLYYYVYTPAALKGYENHPFTLCSWNRAERSNAPSPPRQSLDKEISAGVQPIEAPTMSSQICHSFLIRAYSGFTERLQKKINAAGGNEKGGSTEVTVFLEGPYGTSVDLSGYSDVLMIAGGSGITAAISHTYHLLTHSPQTTLHLVWAVPQRHLVDDVLSNELAAIAHNPRFHMDVYLTSGAEQEQEKPEGVPAYAVRFGRPDIEGVMRETRAKAKSDLAVVTCGTPAMADGCREAVVRLLGEEGIRVGYSNETMLW